MSRPKVIVFISGNGSNLQNIINNVDSDFLKMDIIAVVSNNSDAKGLARAKKAGIETIDALEAMLVDGFDYYLQGNIVKYLWRFRYKNGVEDLKKAQWYLNKLIEVYDDKS